MGDTRIKYRQWEFEVDQQGTIDAYKKIEVSGAEACGCNNCKNFITARQNLYPQEVLDLFVQLGIDSEKEVDASEFTKQEDGLHYYHGLFHFKGKIIKGRDCAVPLPSGGHTIELDEIDPNFSIGFTTGNSLTLLDDENGLVQIEFSTNIPWVIDKELEDK